MQESSYTYYHAEAVKNIMDSNDQDSFQYSAALLIPTTPGLAEGFQCGQGKTTLDYTTIDLQAGLTIDCLRRSLIVHPYFGLRFLEIDRDLTAHYDNELLPGFIGTDSDIIRDSVDYHYDFRGAGLHLGMDITHHLFCNVNFVSDCATSLIIGESDIQYKQLVQTKVGEEFITQETLVDLSEKECILVPGIHISGAFEWRYDCRNCQYCICRTGYEFHYWFQTPQFRKIFETGKTLDANDGNLGLHGAFIKLEYHF